MTGVFLGGGCGASGAFVELCLGVVMAWLGISTCNKPVPEIHCRRYVRTPNSDGHFRGRQNWLLFRRALPLSLPVLPERGRLFKQAGHLGPFVIQDRLPPMLLERFTPAESRMQRVLVASGLIGAVGSRFTPYSMAWRNRAAFGGFILHVVCNLLKIRPDLKQK